MLQAPVYDSLPPTTTAIDNAIGLRKLSANAEFFVDAQMAVSCKFVTVNSDYIRRFFLNHLLPPA